MAEDVLLIHSAYEESIVISTAIAIKCMAMDTDMDIVEIWTLLAPFVITITNVSPVSATPITVRLRLISKTTNTIQVSLGSENDDYWSLFWLLTVK